MVLLNCFKYGLDILFIFGLPVGFTMLCLAIPTMLASDIYIVHNHADRGQGKSKPESH